MENEEKMMEKEIECEKCHSADCHVYADCIMCWNCKHREITRMSRIDRAAGAGNFTERTNRRW